MAWLEGAGLRTVAARAGVDRKTARRYVQAAQAAGLERTAGVGAVDDDLIAAVVSAVRPIRPHGHGAAWEALLGREEQIRAWVNGDGQDAKPLSVVKIHRLLARSGCGLVALPHLRRACNSCDGEHTGIEICVGGVLMVMREATFRVRAEPPENWPSPAGRHGGRHG